MALTELIRSVLENADDDAPRLRVAEELASAGEVGRAEFIRVQCELGRLGYGVEPERAAQLERRAKELLKGNELAWAGFTSDDNDLVRAPRFHRGFVHGLTVKVTMLSSASLAEYLRPFETNPIQTLSIECREAERFAAEIIPHLGAARLKRLSVHSSGRAEPSPSLARLFDASGPPLTSLEALDISGVRWTENDIIELINSQRFPRLSSFRRSNDLFPAEQLKLFVNSSLFSRLKEIDFRLNDAGVQALGAITANALETIWLDAHITTAGGQALADGGPYSSLKKLFFSPACQFEPGALPAIVNTRQMPLLSRLELAGVRADAKALRVLANAPMARTLQHLELRNSKFNDKALGHLAQSSELTNLKYLGLSGTRVTLEGYGVLRARFGDIIGGVTEHDLAAKTAS